MSRMTKFLKQSCLFESAIRDAQGAVELSDFGDIQYAEAQTLKCRREGYVRDVQTATGAVQQSSTRYFFDEAVEVFAGDRVDGKVILSVAEYTNQFGHCEGYEAYV